MPKMSLPMSANRLRSCRRKERRTLGRPDELTMGQVEKEVPAEVLPQKEGPLLGAGGAEVEALAGERAEEVVAAVGTADAGDALAPVTAEAERGGSASDKREAKLAIEKGVALLVERFERLAEETGIRYQNLINSYLAECAARKLRPTMVWQKKGA